VASVLVDPTEELGDFVGVRLLEVGYDVAPRPFVLAPLGEDLPVFVTLAASTPALGSQMVIVMTNLMNERLEHPETKVETPGRLLREARTRHEAEDVDLVRLGEIPSENNAAENPRKAFATHATRDGVRLPSPVGPTLGPLPERELDRTDSIEQARWEARAHGLNVGGARRIMDELPLIAAEDRRDRTDGVPVGSSRRGRDRLDQAFSPELLCELLAAPGIWLAREATARDVEAS
jgi:hypothetical protein